MTAIDCEMTDIQVNTIPELHNGAANAASIPIRAGAIPEQYKWVSIRGMTRQLAASHIKAYVRTYYGIFGAAEVAAANQVREGTHADTPRAHDAFVRTRNFVDAIPLLRKKAMCIGAARAGMLAMWDIRGAHLIEPEAVDTQVLTYADEVVTTIHDRGDARFTLVESLALGMTEFTVEESDILYAIFQLSMAVVPLAGLSILNTGHHYLSVNKTATAAVMKQVLLTSTEATKTWFAADTAVIEDMIWHKSAHPVEAAHLIAQALSQKVADRLRAASMGSAAVRLPYVEPEMKAAQAMIAAVNMVQQTVADTNGVLEVPTLVAAVDAVKTFTVGADDVAPRPDMFPETVVNRRTAINHILLPAVKRATMPVAYALGICSAMMDNASARDRKSTLTTARSLARIRSENLATVAAGAALFENQMRKERNEAAKGKVTGPNWSV